MHLKPIKSLGQHYLISSLKLFFARKNSIGVSDVDNKSQLCFCLSFKIISLITGCKSSESPKIGEGCNACRVALDVENNKCIPECPGNKTLRADKKCVRKSKCSECIRNN